MGKEIRYISTRGGGEAVRSAEAILSGLAPDGGLYVPQTLPRFDKTMREYAAMDYRTLAFSVMRLLLTDYTDEELRHCVDAAYDDKFDTESVCALAEAGGVFYLELWHGKTIAFKDMALSILPHLLTTAVRKQGNKNEIVILTATSGDTGKAALAGFADVPGTRIVVFYPKYGVSHVQERQMVTQEGDNTCVIGITGNFDDAQTGVKKIFTDEALKQELEENGFQFSSANSINIGRLVPQIVYYVYAYTKLLAEGRIAENDAVNFVVPTGNFGNILAAYYAKRMGLPVGKLICASNSNKVLFDFFETGTYDRNRAFHLTASPSMDILISSNLERLIYHVCGDDADRTRSLMETLKTDGKYSVTEEMREGLADFFGEYATEEETAAAIRDTFVRHAYLIDTHTAVGTAAYQKYLAQTGDRTPTVIASTASPFKFTHAVLNAIGGKPFEEKRDTEDDFALADALSKISGRAVPEAVSVLRDAEVLHDTVCETDGMEAEVRRFLGVLKN